MIEAQRTRPFKGIKVSRALYLTHLLVVDDIILLCDGSRRDAKTLAIILDLFFTNIRMMVNFRKSSMSCISLEEEEVFVDTKICPPYM